MGLQLTGVEEALAEHQMLADRARNLQPFLQAEARRMTALIDEAWRAERSPSGRRWPARKERRTARPTRRGRLRAAHRVEAERYALVLRVPVMYASWQFFGTADGDLPGRNPLPFERVGSRLEPARQGEARQFFDELMVRTTHYLSGGDDGR